MYRGKSDVAGSWSIENPSLNSADQGQSIKAKNRCRLTQNAATRPVLESSPAAIPPRPGARHEHQRQRTWSACCPAHDDRNPSLSVTEGTDGRVLLHCHAGCSTEDIRQALGLDWRDLHAHQVPRNQPTHRPPETHPAPRRTVRPQVFDALDAVLDAYTQAHGDHSDSWLYRDADGQLIGAVYRWDTPKGKSYRPAFLIAGGWQMTYPSKRPLYGLDRLNHEGRIYVVEGEKAADRLHALGYPVITSAGGSNAAQLADWSVLSAPDIVILPDADVAGEKYAQAVTEELESPRRTVVTIHLEGLKPGSGHDIVEWIEEVHVGDEMAANRWLLEASERELAKARRTRPLLNVAQILSDPAWNKPRKVLRSGVSWFDGIQPFEGLEHGTLTLLAAPPRCYKTSLLLYLGWQYAVQGNTVHYLAGEMTREAMVRRIVAMAGEISPSILSSPTPEHAERVDKAMQEVSGLGDRLVFGLAPITLHGISQSAMSSDIVIIDYLQLVQPDPGSAGGGRVDELDATMRSLLAHTQHGGTVLAAASLNRVGRDHLSLSSIRGSAAIEYGATAVYATTEELAGVDEDNPPGNVVEVEYRCLKQREGTPKPLRFQVDLPIGPLPLAPAP